MEAESGQQVDVETVALEIFELTKQIWLQAHRRRPEKAYDVSESEFLSLDALQTHGPMTVGDLQRRVQVLPAQMSRIIRNLETKYDEALVNCAINAEDKRKINVQITSRGAEAADQFRHNKIEQTANSLRVLSDDDLRQLLRIVRLTGHATER